MKKIGLIIAMLTLSISGFTQSKNAWHEGRFERAKVFTAVAVAEFNLNETQSKELYDKKLTHFEEQFEANKKFKEGAITEEEKKKPNQTFGRYFNKLTGKTYQELKPFYAKVKTEIDKL